MFKPVILSMLTLFAATAASANLHVPTSGPLTIVDCYSEESGAQLVLSERIVEGGGPITTAVLTQESFGDSRVHDRFQVHVVPQNAMIMGAPVRYVGNKGFELEIKVDTMPIHGRIRSHLTAESMTGRFSEDLGCRFVR